MSAKPVHIGMDKLSFTGKGRLSIIIATVAPIIAKAGDTKNEPAMKAKNKPTRDPSNVLPLLKNNGLLDTIPPKSDAVLSPRQNIAIAAKFTGTGNSNKATSMPIAKYKGAAANS